jgi:putative heme-binding domain-containing protein
VYLGDALPERFRGTLLCCDFIQHAASWWRLEPRGATFAAAYGGPLLESHDTWFTAPDLCEGADGAVYVCDFHDRRTAHPDPDAQWDRTNGRIYRIAPAGHKGVGNLDLGRMSSHELVALLEHPGGWYAEQARVHLAARRDPSVWPALRALARQSARPRLALQGLWALYVSGGFDDALAAELLGHPGGAVRAWTIRLLSDEGNVSAALAPRLEALAADDPSVIVRCQLAATARRLPGAVGLAIALRLLERGLDRDDLYMPLMLWWALESKALTDADALLAFFGRSEAWSDAAVRAQSLRLLRRYAADGSRPGDDACTRLLAAAPAAHQSDALAAVDLGLAQRGSTLGGMGMAGLFGAVAIPEPRTPQPPGAAPVARALVDAIRAVWRAEPGDERRLRAAVRAGLGEATSSVLDALARPTTAPGRRRALLALLAELGKPEGVPAALGALEESQPLAVQAAALDLLSLEGSDRVTAALLKRHATAPPALKARIREVLLSRPASARALLERVDRQEIAAAEVSVGELRQVALLGDAQLDALVRKHWGSVQAGTAEEKLAEMRRLNNDLRAGPGDHERGRPLFQKHCATCHKLFGAGGEIGPDLTATARADTTALLVNIVDPGAVVRTPYLHYVATTTGGRIVTGIIADQDAAGVTLVDAQNQRTTLPRAGIEELRELPGSIMPENLLKTLSPQEVRDLFAYLQGTMP